MNISQVWNLKIGDKVRHNAYPNEVFVVVHKTSGMKIPFRTKSPRSIILCVIDANQGFVPKERTICMVEGISEVAAGFISKIYVGANNSSASSMAM